MDEGQASIYGGSITIAAGDDGLVTSYEGTDETIAPYICIEGGSLSITTEGADGKGIKSRNFISIGREDGSGPDIEIATCGASLTTLPLRAWGGPGGGGPGGGGDMGGGGMGGGGFGDNSSGDSPKAIKAFGTITVNGGNIRISTTQSGAEGIESKSSVVGAITFNGGNTILRCSDDCINSAGSIVFNGGNIYAWSTGNDAVDSNYGRSGAITINGGIIIAHATSSPEEGFDCDNNSYITINGGTAFSTGGQQGGGGSSTPSHSQGYAMVSTNVSSGYFTVTDSNGTVILCCHVPRSLSQAYCMVSAPALKAGESYKCGICSSAPEGASAVWDPYCYEGGQASVSTKSFTAQ